jgi:hypothetical protein
MRATRRWAPAPVRQATRGSGRTGTENADRSLKRRRCPWPRRGWRDRTWDRRGPALSATSTEAGISRLAGCVQSRRALPLLRDGRASRGGALLRSSVTPSVTPSPGEGDHFGAMNAGAGAETLPGASSDSRQIKERRSLHLRLPRAPSPSRCSSMTRPG